MTSWVGHFESTCYHPLLLFNREGDCLAAKLRPGNVHCADDWEKLLLPEIERQQKLGKEVVFRANPAFAKPKIYVDRFSGPGKGWLGAGGTLWEKTRARRARLEATGCILATAGGSKN